jgi:hypothetical membrane protein
MMSVHQINIRAFYKKLYGIVPTKTNDRLFILGLLQCISLPLIGMYDEHAYVGRHCLFAFIFFMSVGFYSIMLGHVMYQYQDKFPQEEKS